MKLGNLTPKKSKAQAMVEFAIALPLLLLLLYGLIETGRLLFIYSTVVTASRQAVRYGAATGENASGTPRYGDCDGIRAAAQKVAFLGPFDTVTVQRDAGPDDPDAPTTYCTGPSDNSWAPTDNNQRLIVTVSEQFTPIVPKIVPFLSRTITATSRRTILVGVPIVVVKPTVEFLQYATETNIDGFNPEPSAPDINEDVLIHVTVINTVDPNITPTGEVVITGADNGICTITLDSNGEGTCILHFAGGGPSTFYPITADYTGDDLHLPSSDTAVHQVDLVPTVTTIGDSPDPSTKNQDVVVTVQVTGGSTTPTGTVDVDAGGNRRCTITLSGNGIGSCTLNFNNTGNYTITATYNGDSAHKTSSNTATHQVLDGTATPSLTPTITPIPPTATITTIPATATITPTAVPSCSAVTHGPITKSGNTMSMTITNPYAYPITLGTGTVIWNHDKGHQTGIDKSLHLQSITIVGANGSTTLWTGNTFNEYTMSWTTPGVIPAGSPVASTVTITFTFHQSYDNFDGTESITINIITNGCVGQIIQS